MGSMSKGKEERKGIGWLIILGIIMIGLGLMWLLNIEWSWPIMLIIMGVVFIVWGLMSRAGLVEEKE
ncbi:MAG TPA: hypothetical protein ENF78_00010 [Candidatus Bathyarchaeota archaeon]|nr:hypothetical protein [Candidatus Bathyarchaeota archaeon]